MQKLSLMCIVLVAVLAASLGACAAGNVSQELDIKPSESFNTLADLQKASRLAVMADVTSIHLIESVGAEAPVDFTVTTVTVRRSSNKSTAPVGSSLAIRQTGTAEHPLTEDPLLVPGDVVVLYLEEFHLTPNDHTGQWVIKGLSFGQFVKKSQGIFTRASSPNEKPGSKFEKTLPTASLKTLN